MDPVVQRIVAIVTAIGPLSNDVVFVGGAIAPLLHTDHTAPPARPTKDVDALIESRTYAAGERHADILRRRGFTHVIERQAHAHRWRSPDGVLFDLVPVGRQLAVRAMSGMRARSRLRPRRLSPGFPFGMRRLPRSSR